MRQGIIATTINRYQESRMKKIFVGRIPMRYRLSSDARRTWESELHLVMDENTTVSQDMVLISEWKTRVPQLFT